MSLSPTPIDANQVITYDPATQVTSMFYDTGADIIGQATVTITAAHTENGITNSAFGTFIVDLLNPCEDPNFVDIVTDPVGSPLAVIDYMPLSSDDANP